MLLEKHYTASPNQQKMTKHPYKVLRQKIIMASVFLTTGLLFESSCSDINVMKNVAMRFFMHNEVSVKKKKKRRRIESE